MTSRNSIYNPDTDTWLTRDPGVSRSSSTSAPSPFVSEKAADLAGARKLSWHFFAACAGIMLVLLVALIVWGVNQSRHDAELRDQRGIASCLAKHGQVQTDQFGDFMGCRYSWEGTP